MCETHALTRWPAGATASAERLSPRPGGDVSSCVSAVRRADLLSCRSGSRPLEGLARFQHRVHDDGQFAGHSDGRALETDGFP